MRRNGLAQLRREVEDTIEKLISFLDRLDGDPDLEDDELGDDLTVLGEGDTTETWVPGWPPPADKRRWRRHIA